MKNVALQLVLYQMICPLALALAFGPWLTLSGLRVLRDPSRIEEPSFINSVIRRAATHSALATGNIRFWAFMVFLEGVVGDIIALFSLVTVVGALRP